MTESLGQAILELDADATPATAALGILETDSLKRMRELGVKLSTMFGSNMKAAMAVGAAAGVVALGALAAGAYKLGQTFDGAYDIIRATTGATGDALDGLKDDFKDVFASVPTTAKDAAKAVGELNQRLGLTGSPLRTVAKQVLELSRLTGTDLGENIQNLTRLFGDWSVATDDMAPTMDQLFRLSQRTGIKVSELAGQMVAFGSPLRQLGFDFNTAAAMFARFEKEGVNTSALMPGLKFALKNLSEPTADLRERFKDLGISLKDGPAAALQGVMAAIKKAPNDLAANAIAFDVFGQRAGPDMAAAIREGRFELDGYVKQMRDGKETVLGAAEDTEDLAQKWQKFRNQIAVKLEPVSSAVFDQVNAALIFLLDNANYVLPVIGVLLGALGVAAATWATTTAISAAQVVFAWFMTQMGAIKSAAVQVASFALLVAQWIILGVQAMASAAMVAAAWLISLGPIGLVIAAVAALVAFIILKWDWVKQATVDVWNWIKGFFSRWWPLILGIMTGGIGLIVGLIVKNWDAIVDATRRAWDWFKDAIVDRVWAVIKFVGGIPGKVLGAIGDLGNLLYDAGKAIVEGLIRGIGDMIGALASKIKDLAGTVVDGVKGILGINSPSRVFIDIGADVVEGFQIGLDAQVGGLTASAGGLGAAVIDAGSAPAQSIGADPSIARLADQLAVLNSSGGMAVIDALVQTVNERVGYRGVAGRKLTAGDGRMV